MLAKQENGEKVDQWSQSYKSLKNDVKLNGYSIDCFVL